MQSTALVIAILGSAAWATGQGTLQRVEILEQLQARGVTIQQGSPPSSSPAAPEPSGENGKPSEQLQKFLQLKFDRRPSTYLDAWSRPTPQPIDEDPEFEAQRAEIAALEAEIAAAQPTEPEATAPELEMPQVPPTDAETPQAEEPPATPAPTPAPPHPKQGELDQKKKAYEAAGQQRRLEIFQHHVTLGHWDRVGAFLGEMAEHEAGQAYEHMLKMLPVAPPPEQKKNVPPEMFQQNTFSFADMLGIVRAAPTGIESKQRKEHLKLLAAIVQRALAAGHAIEELVEILRHETTRMNGTGAFSDREAALLLAGLKQDVLLGEFLPTAEAAAEINDREALNLLARHHLALHGEDRLPVHLEHAWRATQAALAVGEIEEEEKKEALRRAVDLAPKIRDELGDTWLAESFTERPDRGMEILAAIGAQASKGFELYPTEIDVRLEAMQLQKTAVDALLARAPERAEQWRLSLELLAANWLAEAGLSYTNSQATTLGPSMRRDAYGNIYYYNYQNQNNRGPVWALEPGDLLALRPDGRWAELLDDSVKPRLSTVVAELYLKLNEDVRAFPFIEALAATHPKKAHELAEEFLRVWTRNHNPNVANNYTNPYMYIYGFNQRANAIPLTRSKQERNLAELAEWVRKINALPIEPVDQKLLAMAFTSSHSAAEVYRLETMVDVFGSLEGLAPATIAEMAHTMRTNLMGIWRQPNTQQQAQTQRKQQDIEREVMNGYETARRVLAGAIAIHPDHWQLLAERAALTHDLNNYRQEIEKSSDFAASRREALDAMAQAAELYAAQADSLPVDEQTVEPYQLWFYTGLGACDLQFIDARTRPAKDQPAKIRAALAALPESVREHHLDMFASGLFTRMAAVDPAVKVRYLQAGFEIVGDHPQAHEARRVFDYYNDLVTEIRLEAVIDGSDVVGQAPFGVHVNLRHTREIEREAGGFAKYLQNQNNMVSVFNYGRPLENYRDKFQDAATQALDEHFEVLEVTFNSDQVHSIATTEYGWRVTPYAYLLLRARGPEVDKLPSLSIDLDFLDTSGYAVIPVASAPVALDAGTEPLEPRPFSDLEVTQILDERKADEGLLVLEVKATAKGLVPAFEQILDLAPEDFAIDAIDDQGVVLSKFDDDQRHVVSERIWTVMMRARDGLERHPETFRFASLRDESASSVLQRYADADLVRAEPVISLDEVYGEPDTRWPWYVLVAVLIAGGAWFALGRARAPVGSPTVARRLPDEITPFSVLALLRDIERDNHLDAASRRELAAAIETIERHYFGPEEPGGVDLRQVAESWVGRAG